MKVNLHKEKKAMIITFFGHSNYVQQPDHESRVLEYIEKVAGDSPVDFYLGGYGKFDSFALSCAKKYQKDHPNCKICFITPYVSPSYEKTHLKYYANIYDEIIYPPLESVHGKYAISHRNKWMAEHADVVIAFVKNSYGGAFRAYSHAIAKEKPHLNLAE